LIPCQSGGRLGRPLPCSRGCASVQLAHLRSLRIGRLEYPRAFSRVNGRLPLEPLRPLRVHVGQPSQPRLALTLERGVAHIGIALLGRRSASSSGLSRCQRPPRIFDAIGGQVENAGPDRSAALPLRWRAGLIPRRTNSRLFASCVAADCAAFSIGGEGAPNHRKVYSWSSRISSGGSKRELKRPRGRGTPPS
jgi:hypothetical protein